MLQVVARDRGLVAVDKPPGWVVIPGRDPADRRCVRDELSAQLGTRVWVCHRLDRDTSGVLVLATSAEAHRAASRAFEHGEAHKRYLALVRGVPGGPLEIDLPLAEGRRHTIRVARHGEQGKAAFTRVEPLEVFPGAHASLVACLPRTGRQHQLRVHLAAVGHPLLVDPLYGAPGPLPGRALGASSEHGVLLGRTPLHASSLKLPGLAFAADAPMPDDMARALDVLRRASHP